MIDKETTQRLCDSVDALMSEKLHTRITKLEERNIGYKQDIVLLTQENSQMFERLTALEESMYNVQRTLVKTGRPAEPDDSEF